MILSDMSYEFTQREKLGRLLQFSSFETIRHPYVYGVVIPYSSNLKNLNVFSSGVERLSFYSSFALNAAIEMYENNIFQRFILFSDATFGRKRKSTGMLMKEALLRARTTQKIQESDIILLEANHLNNTPSQVKELEKYLEINNLPHEQYIVLCWRFHEDRICKYMRGFGITLDIVSVEEAHEYFNPNFHSQELYQILPAAFESRENKLSLLANFDKRGFIPRALKRLTGPVVTDIQKVPDSYKNPSLMGKGHLVFDNLPGEKKLQQLKE